MWDRNLFYEHIQSLQGNCEFQVQIPNDTNLSQTPPSSSQVCLYATSFYYSGAGDKTPRNRRPSADSRKLRQFQQGGKNRYCEFFLFPNFHNSQKILENNVLRKLFLLIVYAYATIISLFTGLFTWLLLPCLQGSLPSLIVLGYHISILFTSHIVYLLFTPLFTLLSSCLQGCLLPVYPLCTSRFSLIYSHLVYSIVFMLVYLPVSVCPWINSTVFTCYLSLPPCLLHVYLLVLLIWLPHCPAVLVLWLYWGLAYLVFTLLFTFSFCCSCRSMCETTKTWN